MDEMDILALLPAIPVLANTLLDTATLAETDLLTLRLDSLVSVGLEGNCMV